MAEGWSKQRLNLVSSVFLFRNVDEVVVERLVTDQRCYVEKYEKGQIIFDETNFVRCLGIILSGEVQVEKGTADGRGLKMSRSGPGGCFGAAAMFHERPRFLTVITALKPTEVVYLPQDLISWIMQRHPAITENYISYLSDRIWFLNTKISALTAGTAEQKLAVYLMEQGGAECSMTDLSQTLNIGRASLYRAMEDLEERGLIRKGNKNLEVIDMEGLRQLTFSK